MGNTVVASVSPNGEWFAGDRREKVTARVFSPENRGRRKKQPRRLWPWRACDEGRMVVAVRRRSPVNQDCSVFTKEKKQ
jgi:hypothetical protein